MVSSSRSRSTGTSLLRLYPSWWRDRYGDEMTAILEARAPALRARIDLVRGAFDAHLRGPEPGSIAVGGIAAALVAGGAWTVVSVASIGGPTPPDWPGYVAAALPVAVVGAIAILLTNLAVARLAWISSGPSVEIALAAVIVGHLAWAAALAVAALGGPYGAVTAVAQTAAAIATIGVGLILLRARAHPIGDIVVVAGAVMLLPTPAAWLVVGALWTVVGLWQAVEARSGDRPRPTVG